jgi:hypothetical protein
MVATRSLAAPRGFPSPRQGRQPNDEQVDHESELALSGGHARQGPKVRRLSPLEGTGFELVWGVSLSSGCLWFIASSLFGAGGAVLHPVAYDRFPERAEWGQGTETLAKLGALPPSGACVLQRLDA